MRIICSKIAFIILLTLSFINVKSQTVSIPKTLKSDTISKTILDNSLLRVFYLLNYLPDIEKPTIRREAQTFLQIGEEYTRYMDYNKFRWDSICDVSVKSGLDFGQYRFALMSVGKKMKFKKNIIINKKVGNVFYQERVVLNERYEYEEYIPKIEWTLLKGDSIINGYKCKLASTCYRGRSYVAWYAQDLDLPYGPYVFRNLPGLIFKISDKLNQYSFTLNGLMKMEKKDPIYKWTGKNIIPSSREEVRKIYKNYCANPIKAIMNTGLSIKISEKDQASVESKPYNPLELE